MCVQKASRYPTAFTRMSELFPASVLCQDSPRLKWMKRHQVSMRRDNNKFIAEIDEDSWGVGSTEEEALLDLIEMTGLPHWSKAYYE